MASLADLPITTDAVTTTHAVGNWANALGAAFAMQVLGAIAPMRLTVFFTARDFVVAIASRFFRAARVARKLAALERCRVGRFRLSSRVATVLVNRPGIGNGSAPTAVAGGVAVSSALRFASGRGGFRSAVTDRSHFAFLATVVVPTHHRRLAVRACVDAHAIVRLMLVQSIHGGCQ